MRGILTGMRGRRGAGGRATGAGAQVSNATYRRARIALLVTSIPAVATLGACTTTAKHTSTHVKKAATTTSTKPATTTTPTTAPLRTYELKRGDTLASVAKRFRVSMAAIELVNHITDPNRIAEGQVLQIPPTPPLGLVVKPAEGPSGQAFQLVLTGAIPSETITFEIDSPAGKYTGSPHTASPDGAVTATYNTSASDPAGDYVVKANGDHGTTAQVTFHVVNAATPHS